MAKLVLGIGASHSPMVSLTGEDWLEWGKRDHQHPLLFTEDGRHVSYDDWALERGTPLDTEISIRQCVAGAARVGAAMQSLQQTIDGAQLDALVIVGDDQDEQLHSDNLPSFMIYWGDTIKNCSAGSGDAAPMMQRIALGYREQGPEKDYPVATALARHVIDCALEQHFDVAASNKLPRESVGMGHAYGFAVKRLLQTETPLLPIMVNTYNPPSQPRVRRCLDFGRMIRGAIDSFASDMRVGVLASGGLSHFIVQEALDRNVLKALAERDYDALVAIPEHTLQAGSSEIKNWVTTAGICHDLNFRLIDYVPGYRTPAGTGTGLAFGVWG